MKHSFLHSTSTDPHISGDTAGRVWNSLPQWVTATSSIRLPEHALRLAFSHVPFPGTGTLSVGLYVFLVWCGYLKVEQFFEDMF